MSELDGELVAQRLAELATLYVPENVVEGRARLRAEAMAPDAIATTVENRLAELRALCELTNALLGVARPAKR